MTGQEDEDPTSPGHERPGVPLRRPGDAREIAAVVAFLASPGAGYVTGASWAVDVGMLRWARGSSRLEAATAPSLSGTSGRPRPLRLCA